MWNGKFGSWLVTAPITVVLVSILAAACADKEPSRRRRRSDDDDATERSYQAPAAASSSRTVPAPRAASAAASGDATGGQAKLIFLVSRDLDLLSFDPRLPGMSAYRHVGRLNCASGGTPVSMAVDRDGWAWVFYSTRSLFRVSTADASCSPTTYVHPSYSSRLGMGVTAESPGSPRETLYMMSPDFGLATLKLPTLEVSKTEKLGGRDGGELTGGSDGRLFHFDSRGVLSEVDRTTFELKAVHRFATMVEVTSWALSRFAGRFYLFTAGSGMSKTTEYDPATNTDRVRDENLGLRVVGAGQSTLVPPADSPDAISNDAP